MSPILACFMVITTVWVWRNAWIEYRAARRAREILAWMEALKLKPREQWTAHEMETLEAIAVECGLVKPDQFSWHE